MAWENDPWQTLNVSFSTNETCYGCIFTDFDIFQSSAVIQRYTLTDKQHFRVEYKSDWWMRSNLKGCVYALIDSITNGIQPTHNYPYCPKTAITICFNFWIWNSLQLLQLFGHWVWVNYTPWWCSINFSKEYITDQSGGSLVANHRISSDDPLHKLKRNNFLLPTTGGS